MSTGHQPIHSGSNGQTTRGAVSQQDFNRFKLLCRRADGTVALIGLFPTLSGAVNVARSLTRRHLQRLREQRDEIVRDPERPRLLYVERWIGWSCDGRWEEVPPIEGGYCFEFLDRAPRVNRDRQSPRPPAGRLTTHPSDKPPLASSDLGTSVRGERVQAMLLEKRTRKGGWFAKLCGYAASGPIGNWEKMPTHFRPGDQVELVLCGIKLESGYASFRWTDERHS